MQSATFDSRVQLIFGANDEGNNCNILKMCLMRTRDNFVANFLNTRMNAVMLNNLPNQQTQQGQTNNQNFLGATANRTNFAAHTNSSLNRQPQSPQYSPDAPYQSSQSCKKSTPIKTHNFTIEQAFLNRISMLVPIKEAIKI